MGTPMARFLAPQKASRQRGSGKSTPAMLTVLSQQCGMANRRGAKALAIMLEDANGRQEQRSGRDMAEHARRGGGGRAKAARRVDGEISRQHEPAEPGADGQHGRAAAVDRRAVERDQGAAASGPKQLRSAGRRISGRAQA